LAEAIDVNTGEFADDENIFEFAEFSPTVKSSASRDVLTRQSPSECALFFNVIGAVFFVFIGEVPSQLCDRVLNWRWSSELALTIRISFCNYSTYNSVHF
jgi:hypothetical protein